MKDYESFPPLPIAGAEGAYLHLEDGTRLFDASSSWWCKTLGHGHPRLRAALTAQAQNYEHVIAAHTAQAPSAALAEKLAGLAPGLSHVFFGGDGSTAVEITAKLALHAMRIRGESRRTRFASLANGYHGESGFSLGLSDLGMYREPYASSLITPIFLGPLPYVTGDVAALWDRSEEPGLRKEKSDWWGAIESQLSAVADTLCAIVFEPVLQGAGGMRFYDPELLRRLRAFADAHGIYLIADEILTGFHRTGKRLACEHAGVVADMVCLSKGLTGGWLPLSSTLIRDDIYNLFYGDYGQGRDFLHSNTYAGNALACAVALEALQVYADEGIAARVDANGPLLAQAFREMAEATGVLRDVRHLGMVVAGDLVPAHSQGDRGVSRGISTWPVRAGWAVYREAVKHGILWRPLGSTLYWLPPLNTEPRDLRSLRDGCITTLRAVFGLSAPVSLAG
jgi:adenosylmethionine---8-amino-7-oxononanoate aminotransferase